MLDRNIVHGNAISLMTAGPNESAITFSEWTAVNNTQIKRRDFTFHNLISQGELSGLPLFSDIGNDVFIPEPVREYPPTSFLNLHSHER